MDRAEKAARQLRAVSVLRVLKRTRTYDELAAYSGIPASDLNRYVNGHVLPGVERTRRILGEIGWEVCREELDARLRFDEEGYVDNSAVVTDQPLLDLAAPVAIDSLAVDTPDVVLTAATDGITFAAAVASYLDGRCVYAKKTKETAVEEFTEARARLASGIELTYYLPASALDGSDSALVVDDLIRSGETQELLLDLAERSGVGVVGVFALIAVGDEGLARARERTDAPVDAFCHLD